MGRFVWREKFQLEKLSPVMLFERRVDCVPADRRLERISHRPVVALIS